MFLLLLLVKLQASKSNIFTWVFFKLFKLQKWYQIAQSITYDNTSEYAKNDPNFQSSFHYSDLEIVFPMMKLYTHNQFLF